MIVTEEEAKTKRCQESFGQYYITPTGEGSHQPIVHGVGYQHGAGYAVSSMPALPTVASPSHCIGSACMAWRFHGGQTYERGTPLPEGTNPADPEWEKYGDPYLASGCYMQQWRRPLPRDGYCGKAGSP